MCFERDIGWEFVGKIDLCMPTISSGRGIYGWWCDMCSVHKESNAVKRDCGECLGGLYG